MENAQNQGFTCWLPRVRFVEVSRGRRVETVRPLFPRYVFVLIEGAWRSLLSTIGVQTLLLCGEEPAYVREAELTRLRARERAGFVVLPPRAPFRGGEQLRVTDGPFEDCLCLFDEMTADERCAVLLAFAGRKVRLVMGEESLAAA